MAEPNDQDYIVSSDICTQGEYCGSPAATLAAYREQCESAERERCLTAFEKLGEELAEHDRKIWRKELRDAVFNDGVVAKSKIDALVKKLRGES